MNKFRQWLGMMVGDFSWNPPIWMKTACAQWRRTVPALLLVAALGYGGWRGWQWYVHRPQPRTVHVELRAPGVTPLVENGEKLVPEPIMVRFGGSVAPLEMVGKKVTSGVHLQPPQPGEWQWVSDRELRFDSTADWPADTGYRVEIDQAALAAHVLLPKYRFDWSTPRFTAKVSEIEFYQNPKDPAEKQVVATVEFTHKVDVESLKRLSYFAFVGRDGQQPYDVHFDEFQRVAYFRTKSLPLPEHEDFMKLVIPQGVRTLQGGAETREDCEDKVRVPDLYSFFKIEHTETSIVRNKEGDPGQILVVQTTAAAKSADIAKALSVVVLPEKNQGHDRWEGPFEIKADVLSRSTPVEVTVVPSRDELSQVHTFKFRVEQEGQLYVSIARGVKSVGDFVLGQDYTNLLNIPVPQKELSFEGDGGVMALSGERKLSVKSRGLPVIAYEIARVGTTQINHLVSQTEGEFQNPDFLSDTFDQENISRITEEKQPLAMTSRFVANYSTFNFAPELAVPNDGGSERGLFFLKARGWDPVKKQYLEGVSDHRFILVTDLGLIAKENADNTRDVFVASIKNGAPVAGVTIEVLGKNGVPLVSKSTDAEGHAALPSFNDYERDQRPVAYVARLGNDVSFLPYDRDNRRMNFSRFDVGGVSSDSGADLDAFLFTERGVYRPGDPIHVGYIVKRRDWQAVNGLPLEMQIVDARGQIMDKRRVVLPAGGFGETTVQTDAASPTGTWEMHLYLVKNRDDLEELGTTSAWVKEFLPDRMKIASVLSKQTPGWVTPEQLHAAVTLQNLYGAPAPQRRVKAHLNLSPTAFSFADYPDYRFYDRLREREAHPKLEEVELDDQTTDDKGQATFDLELERYSNATYALTFYAEGFEADGGRSVNTQSDVLVSPLPCLVGSKADGDLGYIAAGTARGVQFLAINPGLKPIALTGLHFRLVEHTYVSVLTRRPNGNYEYESVERDHEVRNETRDLPVAGLPFALDVTNPGDFVLEVLDAQGARLNTVSYSVVGKGAGARSLDRDAELQIKLPKHDFAAGENLEVAITAPYTGSGLITIERDKVYAHAWFKADTTSSVQHITLPADFEGTAYVNVTFVRGLDSHEIYTSPLSYAVEAVTVNREKRHLGITLQAAAQAKPGEPLHIHYHTDRPSRIAIFAVDQGILQVSDYTLPDPLAEFFQKAALQVGTSQILDLIMPEFSILRAISATGGGEDMLEKNLNPFQRVTEKPVVFWSGIVDADATDREVIYNVPDFFDGTLKVMAVAYAPDATGSVEQSSLIRDRYVITPSTPTVAAPGDTFEVGVTVANGGKETDVQLAALVSEQLEIVKSPAMPLHLAKNAETSVSFTIKTLAKLGSARLQFTASGDGEESRRSATLSVRPPVPYVTQVRGGRFTGDHLDLPVERPLLPQYRKLNATISALPLGLAGGLDAYLHSYPYGCSEQITSGAFCRLLLADESDFGLSHDEIAQQLEHVYAVERTRQNDQGGFGYWTAENAGGIDFISVYVTHFMIEARAAGFEPPADMLAAAIKNLQQMVTLKPGSLAEARTQAYAIYVLTRDEVVTTNYILNLRDTLDHQFAPQWMGDLIAVYLAGSLEMLQQDKQAVSLIRGYSLRHSTWEADDFYPRLGGDAQYVSILARHFPQRLQKLSMDEFRAVLDPIQEGEFSTLSAAYAVMALKSYSQLVEKNGATLDLSEVDTDQSAHPVALQGALTKRGDFSALAKTLHFAGHAGPMGIFCQDVVAGFDTTVPTQPVKEGLEVYRELPATAKLGDPITVHLKVRRLGDEEINNVAVEDLLPGGFEVVNSSIQPGSGTVPGFDYVEVREDRVVLFGSIGRDVKEVTYQIKPTNRGTYTVPPPFAESMYNRGIHGHGVASTITVTGPTK